MRFIKPLGLIVFAVTIAGAASEYTVQLVNPTRVGATELKPGKYKVAVENDKVVFKNGKDVVAQAPATVEQGKETNRETSVSTSGSNLQNISVGGTKMTIVLKGN